MLRWGGGGRAGRTLRHGRLARTRGIHKNPERACASHATRKLVRETLTDEPPLNLLKRPDMIAEGGQQAEREASDLTCQPLRRAWATQL